MNTLYEVFPGRRPIFLNPLLGRPAGGMIIVGIFLFQECTYPVRSGQLFPPGFVEDPLQETFLQNLPFSDKNLSGHILCLANELVWLAKCSSFQHLGTWWTPCSSANGTGSD